MPLLCIDTSTSLVVAALVDASGAVTGSASSGRAQALLELVDELLDAAGRPELTALAVGVGPGGFTGVRIGVTTARGIAEALDIPLHAINSLQAIAADVATEHPDEVVWGAIDARRGEYFVQPFRAGADGIVVALGPARAIAVADLDDLSGIVVATDGMDPRALARTALAVVAAAEDGAGDPLHVVPDYVRAPDAEPARLQLRIDPLVLDDLDALMRLEERCFPAPWSRGMYEEELVRPANNAVHLAARDDAVGGRLLGAGLASRIGDSWHIMNILVDPSAQRRGIGARLLEQLIECSSQLGGGDGWTLEVRPSNTAAIALYEAHGFLTAGMRPGYYAETGEDAFVMWRSADNPVVPA
ncbi:MAG: ribosomal-protein-alanine acetyltransferase [Thermoleophilia bacterium]|nr:ribosomal-protein-alanine acetyltransferase [Thermoleophilia bacterium]